jgi:ParB family chromosome partitioning protein
MVVRRDERIARLAFGSGNRAGRLKSGEDAPQLVETIAVDTIDADPDQPRRNFDPAKLQELADSLASVGQLQPIILVRAGARYRLHVGERRWRATQLAGLNTVRAIVRETPLEARAARIAQIVENEQRDDLSVSELVAAVHALRADGLKNIEIAAALSKSPARISELLALADAPDSLRAIVDRVGLDLSYQLLRQWRVDPKGALDFIAHMPIDHISRVTIATIGQSVSDPAVDPEAPAAGAMVRPVAPGGREGVGEGASPRGSATPLGPSPSGDTGPTAGETDSRLLIPIIGTLLVEHPQHGNGHVVFGLDVASDHLAISFAGAPPIPFHKDDIRLLRTIVPEALAD